MMTAVKWQSERKEIGDNQNTKATKYPSDYTTNINCLFTSRLGDFIYFHLWNSLQALNLSEQGGWEGQGCPWQQSVSYFYIQGRRGTNDTTRIHYCDTGACTGEFCCPAAKWDAAVKKETGMLESCKDVRYCIEAGAEKEALAPDNREMKVLLRIHNWIWFFFCLILIESGRPLTEVMPTNSVLSTVAGRGEMHFGIPSCPKSRLTRTCQDLVTRSRFDSLHY